MNVVVATAAGVVRFDGEGPPIALPGHDITSLSPDARWALTDGRTVQTEQDGQWSVAATLPDGLEGTCLLDAPGGVLVGTVGAHLLRLAGNTLEPVDTFDHVEGRDRWTQPWGAPGDCRSLAAADDVFYVNPHVGGVVRSDDGGASWRPVIDVATDVHQIVAAPGGLVVAATGAAGLAVSRDRGEHWEFVDRGFHAPYCRAVALADGAVLVSASTGPSTRQGAVYRWESGAVERAAGLPERFAGNVDTHWIAAGGDVAALAGPDRSVWWSTDGGRSWERLGDVPAAVRAVALAA
jgi:hypothetical protein